VYLFFELLPVVIGLDVLAGAVTAKGQERLLVPAEVWVLVCVLKKGEERVKL